MVAYFQKDNSDMFYIRIIAFLGILLVFYTLALKPKRYTGIRKHSTKKRDYRFTHVSGRNHFHKLLMSTNRHLPGVSDAVDIVIGEPTRNRVVGAFVYMNHDLLQRNKDLIKRGVIKRNAAERQRNSAPYMSQVKHRVVDTGSGKASLYHLTHLIAFRHSLSEGDANGLLFTGTAHLNSGSRYDLNYVPAYSRTKDSTTSRVNTLKELFFQNNCQLKLDYPTVDTGRNFGSRGPAQYSLNEFELFLDFLVNWKKTHVFKYGVECYYTNGSDLVHHVRVIIIDVTQGRLLVDVLLMNKL